MPDRLVVFDGYCLLCSRAVRFILRFDRRERFSFAAYQNLKVILPDDCATSWDPSSTILLIEHGSCYFRADAVIRILRHLYGFSLLARLLRLMPLALTNGIYSLVSKNRQRWFGTTDRCMVPEPRFSKRFIQVEGEIDAEGQGDRDQTSNLPSS